MYHWYGPGPGFGLWWIFPLVFGGLWLLLVGLLVWRLGWPGPRLQGASPDAVAVLRDRFARGEIDAEEYEQRRRLLERR